MNLKDVSHNRAPLLVDGKPLDTFEYSATEAKNEFGHVLEIVTQGRAVVITKHAAPKAVLVSFEEFRALAERGERHLVTLKAEFDELFSDMQTPKARAGMKEAFDASPMQLGKAALRAAKRGR